MQIDTKCVDEFSRLFYDFGPWQYAYWCGVPILKNPLDLFVMQEIIYEVKPHLIIETGTYYGGSALYYAQVLDALHFANSTFDRLFAYVLTIDIEETIYPLAAKHPRIHWLTMDSKRAIPAINSWIDRTYPVKNTAETRPVLVVLDSDHSKEHVLRELDLYAPLVTPGSYLVLEDTNVEGPRNALAEWLPAHPEFEADRCREKFLCTFNPGAFLRRKI